MNPALKGGEGFGRGLKPPPNSALNYPALKDRVSGDLMNTPFNSSDRKRLVVVSVFLSVLFCLLIVRFYQIQILQGDKWTQIAMSQHQYVAQEPFMRGSFYSNTSIKKGHPEEAQAFVIDVLKFHL